MFGSSYVVNFAVSLALIELFFVTKSVAAADLPYWLKCYPNEEYVLPDNYYCDKYYTCKDGVAVEKQCQDGFGFVPFAGCKPLYQVECGSRIYLQPPRGSGKCPRLNGVFSAPEGCGKFYKCYEGIAQPAACPNGQMFDEVKAQCRYPTDLERYYCSAIWYPKQPAGQVTSSDPQASSESGNLAPPVGNPVGEVIVPEPNNFSCPINDNYPFGDHSRQPIPGQCKFFLLCIFDGTRKIAGCPEGLGFNPITSLCENLNTIPGCNVGKLTF